MLTLGLGLFIHLQIVAWLSVPTEINAPDNNFAFANVVYVPCIEGDATKELNRIFSDSSTESVFYLPSGCNYVISGQVDLRDRESPVMIQGNGAVFNFSEGYK